MNYIYDIYLNFNKELYDFFDWNKSDKLTHIKMIPIFKVNEDTIKSFISNTVKLDEKTFSLVQNKSTIWNKANKYKNYALFADENNVIAIEFDDEGKSINKSYLLINEELEILETAYKLRMKNIEYRILNKDTIKLKTRKQIKEENFITDELKNIDNNKLNYIYFECFGKHENDRNLILNKLLNLSKNSKTYKNLYNILKLTSTTNK